MMTKNMTDQEYIGSKGEVCPVCRKSNVDFFDGFDFDGTEMFQRVHCRECDAEWMDEYKLTGYSNLIRGDAS